MSGLNWDRERVRKLAARSNTERWDKPGYDTWHDRTRKKELRKWVKRMRRSRALLQPGRL